MRKLIEKGRFRRKNIYTPALEATENFRCKTFGCCKICYLCIYILSRNCSYLKKEHEKKLDVRIQVFRPLSGSATLDYWPTFQNSKQSICLTYYFLE